VGSSYATNASACARQAKSDNPSYKPTIKYSYAG
ncbi:unnamed protein product, partial [marine sediment metagenome]